MANLTLIQEIVTDGQVAIEFDQDLHKITWQHLHLGLDLRCGFFSLRQKI